MRQVNMERQFEGRQGGYGQTSQYGAIRMQDRWSARAGPAGGYDRFSNAGAYAGVHMGEYACLYSNARLTVSVSDWSSVRLALLAI